MELAVFEGKVYRKTGRVADIRGVAVAPAFDGYRTAPTAGKAKHHRQPEAGTLALGLGGEERLEHFIHMFARNPGAIICDRQAAIGARAQRQTARGVVAQMQCLGAHQNTAGVVFIHLADRFRGIGDEIEPPDGDDYEYIRILFDISFFFFIIVILLAIIQGFIIDAFGALRDQLQGVEDELGNNCFICGIGKDYLDGIPHGFEIHVKKEHNLANYLFFLMYLINKDENDYTGQETYVWNMYQER